MAPRKPAQIPYDNSGDVRRELDAKIEKRVPIWVFVWVIGFLVILFGTLMGLLYARVCNDEDKIQEHEKNIVSMETRIGQSGQRK